MSIILLGKGESINKLTKEIILSHNYIAWANIHNHVKFDYLIPNKVDFLFIRNKTFINDLTKEQKLEISSLNIKHVFIAEKNIKKILNYPIEKEFNTTNEYGFNASTGLIAFNYLVTLSPDILTIAGLDLFTTNNNLYYFNDINDNLSSKKTNDSLKQMTTNGKLKKSLHDEENTIKFIIRKIKENPNIKFIFYTLNEILKNNINQFKNVEVL